MRVLWVLAARNSPLHLLHSTTPVGGIFLGASSESLFHVRSDNSIGKAHLLMSGAEKQKPNLHLIDIALGYFKKEGYTVKGKNPRALVDSGISPKSIPVGDTVTVEGLRSRENPLNVGFATITTSSGLKIFLGNSNFP